MSRRDLVAPSFVDALVRGCAKSRRFSGPSVEEALDWSAFDALLSPIHAPPKRGAGLAAAC